jgi:uncharacterized zinc-type alcohol dehydrogenase-like protein
MEIERLAPKAGQVCIDVLYYLECAIPICIKYRNDWHNTIALRTGPRNHRAGKRRPAIVSTSLRLGDLVGVGCMVDSCGTCPSHQEKRRKLLQGPVGWTATYNGYMKPKTDFNTFGELFNQCCRGRNHSCCVSQPRAGYQDAAILCAGVTAYSPMKHWK